MLTEEPILITLVTIASRSPRWPWLGADPCVGKGRHSKNLNDGDVGYRTRIAGLGVRQWPHCHCWQQSRPRPHPDLPRSNPILGSSRLPSRLSASERPSSAG